MLEEIKPFNDKYGIKPIIKKKVTSIQPLDIYIELVVSEGKETIKNLYDYDVEDFISLVELIIIDNFNRKVDQVSAMMKMKQG